MEKTDISLYHYFTINERYFKDSLIFRLVNYIRDVCYELFRKQYIQLRTLFVNFFLESHGRYYFNILRMITILYNLYIDYEIYHMAYNKKINRLNENLFLEETMSKWDVYITFSGILSNIGH